MVALVEDEVVVGDEVVLVDVGDDVVVVGVVVVVVVEVEVEVLDEVVVKLEVVLQSWAASALTVPAPCPRFCSSVGLTDCGSFVMELFRADAALWAWEQS